MSLASEEIRVMNSTEQEMSRSRASRAKVGWREASVLGGGVERISEMIFWTVAVWMGGKGVSLWIGGFFPSFL